MNVNKIVSVIKSHSQFTPLQKSFQSESIRYCELLICCKDRYNRLSVGFSLNKIDLSDIWGRFHEASFEKDLL